MKTNLLSVVSIIAIITLQFTQAQTLTLEWAKRAGGNGHDQGNKILTDSSGNIYVCGFFAGTADFDPGSGTTNLTASGQRDLFISKFTSGGNMIWVKQIGGTGYDEARGMTLDASGNLIITGFFSGSADMDPGSGTAGFTSAGNSDIFILKLDSAGSCIWARQIGGTDADIGQAVCSNSMNEVYITGSFYNSTVDFDPGTGTGNSTSNGGYDIFIVKLSSSGSLMWYRTFGSASNDFGRELSADAAGNLLIIGYFSLTVDFDPGSGTSNHTATNTGNTNNFDIFILKLNSSGNFIWSRQFGNTGDDRALALSLDAAGGVYTTGYFSGTVDFNPGSSSNNLTAVQRDAFISKLDSSGSYVWAKSFSGYFSEGQGLCLDASGNVYVTGIFHGTVDFNPGGSTFNLTTSTSSDDGFIAKLDASGNYSWACSIGTGNLDDLGRGISADNMGKVYSTGYFQGTVDFDPGSGTSNLTGSNGPDMFFMKVGQTSPLPVTVISFSANTQPSYNQLDWATASEKDNDYFELEYSTDAIQFQSIGKISGAGNSNTVKSYRFLHLNPARGISYYRLRQVDFNGDATHSRVISLNSLMQTEEIRMYPNPCKGFIQIFQGNADEEVSVVIRTSSGQEIYAGNMPDGGFMNIETAALPAGNYIAEIRSASGRYYKKFVKE